MLDFAEANSLDLLLNLAIAAVVGFLVGFEREWVNAEEDRENTFAGARTFTLVGIAGGLTGVVSDGMWLASVAFAAIAGLTIVSYWVQARDSDSRGGTTEIAIFAVFLLGYAAGQGMLLVAAIGGVSVAILLSLKASVEKLAESLTQTEVHAALRLLAISVLILPALPNQGFGPYDALNPREIWLMVVFISGLSFVGYWFAKMLGPEHGALVTGVVGGLASSTATTLSLSKFAREGSAPPGAVAAGIVAANVVMLIRVGFLLAAVSRNVLTAIWPVLAAGALTGAIAALFLWLRSNRQQKPDGELSLGNPMEIKPALIFAALLAVISIASSFGADRFGEAGLFAVGLISGLADVDAITLTAGRQAANGAVDIVAAGGAVMAGVASNIVTKGGMAASIGGAEAGAKVGIAFALVIAAGAAAYLFLL